MIKIWGRKNAFNVQKVMWLIDELAIPHELIPAGGQFGGLETPAFLSMNPHGRIPVIADDGFIVWESHAILRYLAARFGQGSFWSDEAMLRSQSDRWMDWSQSTLQPNFLNGIFRGFYRTPESQQNLAAIQESIQQCSRHFLLLNEILCHQAFLGGDTLTLADIPAGAILYRYFGLDIERPPIPYVEAWYERLKARAPYRDNVMISFADMKGRLD